MCTRTCNFTDCLQPLRRITTVHVRYSTTVVPGWVPLCFWACLIYWAQHGSSRVRQYTLSPRAQYYYRQYGSTVHMLYLPCLPLSALVRTRQQIFLPVLLLYYRQLVPCMAYYSTAVQVRLLQVHNLPYYRYRPTTCDYYSSILYQTVQIKAAGDHARPPTTTRGLQKHNVKRGTVRNRGYVAQI